MQTADDQLVALTLDGDLKAYRALVERYRHAALALAFHLLGDFADAEDVAQEALTRAYYRLHQLREPASFGPWLRRIVANLCRTIQRREGRRGLVAPAALAGAEVVADPYHEAVARELGDAVATTVAGLAEPDRLALTMYCIDGLSYVDIAHFLGSTPDAIKMRVHRARRRLRADMADLVAETFREHALGADFTREVSRMTVSFGVSGNGDSRSVLPDDEAGRLYVRLYPTGMLAEAATETGTKEAVARKLVRKWQDLQAARVENGRVTCLAPIVRAADVRALRSWYKHAAEAMLEEIERRVDDLRALGLAARGEAPIESALEAAVAWYGQMAVYGGLERSGLVPPRPVRGRTGDYHPFGFQVDTDLPGYPSSAPNFGDREWGLAVYTWYDIEGHRDVGDFLHTHDFPMSTEPQPPLAARTMKVLRAVHERPRTRRGLLAIVRRADITEYLAGDFIDGLIRLRLLTGDEPYRLRLPVFDEREGTPLAQLLREIGGRVAERLTALEPLRQKAVARCSFRDCLPADVAHVSHLCAVSSLMPMLFDRGLAPARPAQAYAERGVFLRHWGSAPK